MDREKLLTGYNEQYNVMTAMNETELKILYTRLVDDAFTTIDSNVFWHMTVPACLSRCDITCNDGTSLENYT